MPKITALKAQKRSGRVNVYLDDQFFVGIDEKTLVDLNLYKGKDFTDNELEKLKEASELSKALSKAYNLLSYRPRTEFEIRDKLKGVYSEANIKDTVDKLKSYGLINDNEYAKNWIESRKSKRGRKAITFELKRKGVEADLIEDALQNISKEEELVAAVTLVKKKKAYLTLTKNEAYGKIAQFLGSKGYDYDIIKGVITEIYER